jgi:ComF family protein
MLDALGGLLRGGAKGGAGLARGAVDLLLPARCGSCGVVVPEPGLLCSPCWRSLDFISEPYCASCGLPFDFDPGGVRLCGACLADPPAYHRARAVLRYDAAAKRLLLPFKHADRTEGAATFARWMARAAPDLLAACDLLVPVPLHWRRLWRRRYNQSALLAQQLGRLAAASYAPGLLRRKRATPPQGHLSRAARRRNVAGAFEVPKGAGAHIAGRSILLVDDVMTTGATLEACAQALLRAGAARIEALVMARVV